MSHWFAKFFVALQHVIPKYAMTALIYRLSRLRRESVKNFLISRFVAAYDVDLADIDAAVPDDFPTFNAFFTRALGPDARPVDQDEAVIVAPVDGTVSAMGAIHRDRIYQAKSKDYSLHELLATDLDQADAFLGGSFATIYLAPYNYHRVHAPLAGRLRALHYVPGDLFSVNSATVNGVTRLFCRNERLVCHFDTAVGPAALIFVGALNVGSISTPWTGEIRPTKRGIGEAIKPSPDASLEVEKGDLLGWFNMGSTVILLFPPGTVEWQASFAAGDRCRFGEVIARRITPA